MAKVVIRFQNQILSETVLEAGFNGIGRLPTHPICIENLGISRSHAFIFGDIEKKIFILQDLASLNGTYVNKKRVQKWLLKPNDVITIGQHALEYIEDSPSATDTTSQKPITGQVPLLEDLSTGKTITLNKDITYFGNSSTDDIHIPGLMVGKQFASIDRKGTAWVLNLLVKRFTQLSVNGVEVTSTRLAHGDEIEAAGMKFSFIAQGQ